MGWVEAKSEPIENGFVRLIDVEGTSNYIKYVITNNVYILKEPGRLKKRGTLKMFKLYDPAMDIITQWADLIDEDEAVKVSTPVEMGDDWTLIPAGRQVQMSEEVRPLRWCRDGNACQWKDCGYRHEVCTHFLNKKCQHTRNDPRSCMSPAEGGCKYDHRKVSMLPVRPPMVVSIRTEEDLWNHFGPEGLDAFTQFTYNSANMGQSAYERLKRSLAEASSSDLEYERSGSNFVIKFTKREEPLCQSDMDEMLAHSIEKHVRTPERQPIDERWYAAAKAIGILLD